MNKTWGAPPWPRSFAARVGEHNSFPGVVHQRQTDALALQWVELAGVAIVLNFIEPSGNQQGGFLRSFIAKRGMSDKRDTLLCSLVEKPRDSVASLMLCII